MTNPPTMMTCPKCHGSMRSYERNRVHVAQCQACHGIFLDAGELEALVRAANATPAPAEVAFRPYPDHYPQTPGHAAPVAQPPYAPAWGQHPPRRRGGIAGLFFSS